MSIIEEQDSTKYESFQDLEGNSQKDHQNILKARAKPFWTNKTKGVLSIISGFIWMLYVGSHFMIGNIVPYIYSYFPDATESQSQTIFSMVVFVTIFANFTGSNLLKRRILSPRVIIFIGGTVGIGGCYISSLTTSWTLFRIIFPLSYGFAVGFTYMVHLYLAWQYIPGYEGLFSGIVNAGFGAGGFIFTYLSTSIINPNSVDPNEEEGGKPFSRDIADRLPIMLQKFCFVWVFIFVITLITVQENPAKNSKEDKRSKNNLSLLGETSTIIKLQQSEVKEAKEANVAISKLQLSTGTKNDLFSHERQRESDQERQKELDRIQSRSTNLEKTEIRTQVYLEQDRLQGIDDAPLMALLKTKQFIFIFIMNILSVLFGLFVIGSSKSYGDQKLKNEAFLSLAASLSSVFGIFRFGWSLPLQNVSYKAIYAVLICIQILIAFGLPLIFRTQNQKLEEIVFLFSVGLSQLCEGGHFVLVPTILAKLFGTDGGMRVFSVGFGFVGVASLVNTGIISMVEDSIGFEGICYLYGSFSIVALILLIRFKEEKVHM